MRPSSRAVLSASLVTTLGLAGRCADRRADLNTETTAGEALSRNLRMCGTLNPSFIEMAEESSRFEKVASSATAALVGPVDIAVFWHVAHKGDTGCLSAGDIAGSLSVLDES